VRHARERAAQRLGQWVRGKYRLDTLLGVGGMASVYAATHRNGARVALKILHPEFAREDAIRRRFLREGYVANKVDHPGRVAILDDDVTDDGEPFLVMELLEGETLQQLWKRHQRKVPVAEAVRIAAAVLETLAPFHEQKIVHRDLKPANVFITSDGTVKLLDFGVAQLREGGEALTRAGTALGTPSYMSPEQAMGKSDQLDGRSDVFSVGATLYAILSGKRLHHGRSDNEAFILAATQPAPSLARAAPDLPVEVIALVDRALSWDRRKRYQTVHEMRDACRAVLTKVDAEPKRPAAAPPLPQPSSPGDSTLPTLAEEPSQDRESGEGRSSRPTAPTILGGSEPRAGGRRPGPAYPGPPPNIAGRNAPLPASARAALESARPKTGGPTTMVGHSAQAASTAPPTGTARPETSPRGGDREAALTPEEEAVILPLRDLFQRLERALPTMRQYGLDHPEGGTRLRAVHRTLSDVLKTASEGLSFEVHPFCFTHQGIAVWEPNAPNDLVPYRLASTGIEEVRVTPGVSEHEVRAFLEAAALDGRPSGAERDIGAELWEAGLQHITFKIREVLTDTDAREQVRFFSESDELEADVRAELADALEIFAAQKLELDAADSAEAAAMAMSTDKASFALLRASSAALALDATTQSALRAQLAPAATEWHERFIDVAAEAAAGAHARGELDPIARRLELYAGELAEAKRYGELFALHEQLAMRLEPAAASALGHVLFGWKLVERMFATASAPGLGQEERSLLLSALRRALPLVDPAHLDAVLKLASTIEDEELRDIALAYIERVMAGHEARVVSLLDHLRVDLAQRMLARVAQSGDGRALLEPLLTSKNPWLRCEATAFLAPTPEEAARQLLAFLESPDGPTRSACLTTLRRHEMRAAGPALVRLVEHGSFYQRAPSEQRELFETLYKLSAARAERLLIGILDQHGMLADENLDQVRALAAQVMGSLADSAGVLDSLENAARLRPWNTQNLRQAAQTAIDAIQRRLQHARAPREAER
jgi:serine/threonine protein kinase